jgi:hypothetical protein
MTLKLPLLFAIATFAAFADPMILWNFDSNTCTGLHAASCGDNHATFGNTQAFNPVSMPLGPAITATGFGPDGAKLFLKEQFGTEDGLGLVGKTVCITTGTGKHTKITCSNTDPDNEIVAGTDDAIKVDLTNAINSGYTDFEVALGSVQAGEEGEIITAGGSKIISQDETLVPLPPLGGQDWFVLKGFSSAHEHSDVLLMAVTATTVPEPASILLLGSGLLVAATLLRRKVRNQQSF